MHAILMYNDCKNLDDIVKACDKPLATSVPGPRPPKKTQARKDRSGSAQTAKPVPQPQEISTQCKDREMNEDATRSSILVRTTKTK